MIEICWFFFDLNTLIFFYSMKNPIKANTNTTELLKLGNYRVFKIFGTFQLFNFFD